LSEEENGQSISDTSDSAAGSVCLPFIIRVHAAIKVLVGKPEGKRPLGRPRRRWEDNIKMDLQEVGKGCGDWMELAKNRNRWRKLVSTVMNFLVP
jgi:hypothetical protein